MTNVNNTDIRILSYLLHYPYPRDYSVDTYFVNTSKYQKNSWVCSRVEAVERWVIKHGGKFEVLSECMIKGLRKGCMVKIIFPTYTKRNMKKIMSILYYNQTRICSDGV